MKYIRKILSNNFPRTLSPQKQNQLEVKSTFLAHVALWKITESGEKKSPAVPWSCVI